MEMKFEPITLGIKLDMQELYDNLIIYKKSIEAQIESLAKEPSICTHKKTEEHDSGVIFCKVCGRTLDSGKFDYVR